MRRKAETLDKLPGLVDWVNVVLASGRFKSRRQGALAAGFSEAALAYAMQKQRASLETVMALADAAGIDRVTAFMAIGWIRDIDMPKSRLSSDERKLIEHARNLSPKELHALIEVSAALQLRAQAQSKAPLV